MQQITVEPPLGQKLFAINGQAILCDENGRVLGFFSPYPEHPPIEELQLEPPRTVAELEELRKVRTGKPLEEILRRLGL